MICPLPPIALSPSHFSWTLAQQNHLRTPGKASTFWGLERCSLYFTPPHASPCTEDARVTRWSYVHGQTQTWAEDPGFCVSPVPAPTETGSSYLSIPPKCYLLGGPYAFIPYVFIQPLRVLNNLLSQHNLWVIQPDNTFTWQLPTNKWMNERIWMSE